MHTSSADIDAARTPPAGTQADHARPPQGRRALRALGLALVVFAAASAPAAAADLNISEPEFRGAQECDPGHHWASVSAVVKEAKVTHARRWEHFTGGPGSYTKTAERKDTVTAALTMATEVQFEHKLVFAELDAKVSATLHAEGQSTTTGTVSITANLPKNDVYIFYGGTMKFSGQYNYYRCTSGGKVQLVNSGEVHSWDIETEGAVGCTQEVPKQTLAATAKAQYCAEGDATAYLNFLLNAGRGEVQAV